MSKHLITVEVDTDRTKYDTPWAADYDHVPPMPDSDVRDYAATFGGEPGAQWDHPPLTRVVSVRPVETRPEIDWDRPASFLGVTLVYMGGEKFVVRETRGDDLTGEVRDDDGSWYPLDSCSIPEPPE